MCGDLYEWNKDAEWVYIAHWDYFAMLLLNNRHHENIKSLLLPFHEQFFYLFANGLRVLRPVQSIRLKIEKMRDELFAPYR